MTDTPPPDLTAPEHVERLVRDHDMYARDVLHTDSITAATLRALSAKLEAAEAERDAALKAAQDRDIAALQQAAAMAKAMNDLIVSPKGVVPASARQFYDSVYGRFFGLSVKPDRSRI